MINSPIEMATTKQRELARPSFKSCVSPLPSTLSKEVFSFTIHLNHSQVLTITVTAVDGVRTRSTDINLNSSCSLLAITVFHFKIKTSFIYIFIFQNAVNILSTTNHSPSTTIRLCRNQNIHRIHIFQLSLQYCPVKLTQKISTLILWNSSSGSPSSVTIITMKITITTKK